MQTSYLLINTNIIDPLSGTKGKKDILVKHSKIAAIGVNLQQELGINLPQNLEIIDCANYFIIPLLFDMHVHLRVPGGEHKETFATGLLSALAGGVGTVLAMPNTSPPTDNAEILSKNYKQANSLNLAHAYFAANVSIKMQGKDLTDFKSLKSAGCIALKTFPEEHANEEFFAKVLQEAKKVDLPVICHCEQGDDHSVTSEIKAVEKVIKLVKKTGARIHIAHVSTKGACDLIAAAKKNNLPITAEACPHHLFLNDSKFAELKGYAKTNPPLRDEANRLAVIDALKNGIIDVIATDHAPHAIEEKNQEFTKVPPGTTGLETLLATVNTFLVQTNEITIEQALRKMTIEPARILDIKIPSLQVGNNAEFMIFDPQAKWIVKGKNLVTKAKSSIFENMSLQGKVKLVMMNGEIKFQANKNEIA